MNKEKRINAYKIFIPLINAGGFYKIKCDLDLQVTNEKELIEGLIEAAEGTRDSVDKECKGGMIIFRTMVDIVHSLNWMRSKNKRLC